MSEIKITSITVRFLNPKDNVQKLIQAALDQNASSSSLLAHLSTDDAAMHGLGNDLQSVYTKFKASPPTALKSEVETAVLALVMPYNGNASEIQTISRKAATDAGDVNVGITLVKNSGYKLKNPRKATGNAFEVKQDGIGAVIVTTKAVAPRATYIRQFGQCSNRDVVPAPDAIQELLISPENDIRVSNLRSITCYAFREATILPISRKKDSGSIISNVGKKATQSVSGKSHRRTFNASETEHYIFGPWVWVVVL